MSDLVSFGGSDDELADDSMSLVASDTEELSGSVTDLSCPYSGPVSRQRQLSCPFSEGSQEVESTSAPYCPYMGSAHCTEGLERPSL